ncbi:capsid protein [Capybara associated cyclovirus 1]|uniref:Capsid protein n=1 Tax=Capybara associated cyclovirus 1 TaxID=2604905 RepID=A0A5P8PPN6_9CIRC|nr:capsid protein [Capybara associated cyclovirus 1]QFR58250.1 capsid protein [Capybara associated cyclovirus 1]
MYGSRRFKGRRTRLPWRRSRFVRRRRGRFSRRTRRNYRRHTGNLVVLGRTTLKIVPNATTETTTIVQPMIDDFKEFDNFKYNFEMYKMLSVRIKVTPVNNIQDGQINGAIYWTAPWKRPVNTPAGFTAEAIQSLDKARSHHICSTMTRHFVPAIQNVVAINGTGEASSNLTNSQIIFKPWISVIEDAALTIRHHCGLVNFPAMPTTNAFTLTVTAKVMFKNQKNSQLN